MDEIWTILGLEPTEDVSAIKRAYAQAARACHPEEDPEGFLRLRKAYEVALAYAEKGMDPEPHPAGPEEAEEEGWTLSSQPMVQNEGPNPYADHAAAQKFLDIYTGGQRKNPKAWMDYFTSGAFLDVAWERQFTALLLEQVTRLEAEYPLNREFVNWLYIIYQFTVTWEVYWEADGRERTKYIFQLERNAQFEGQEFLFEIAKRGPKPKAFKGMERAMQSSFAEYRALAALAEAGRWEEEQLKKAGSILDCYVISSLEDRNPTESQRHPAGLRLLEHIFRRNTLPKELYSMAWQKLELKTALMGRAKLLYGGLRERVLERFPDIAEEVLDLRQLNKEFEVYRQSVRALEETGRSEDWARAEAETRAFFARPDFQKALWNRRFAEEHMKYHVQWSGEHFIREILAFYERHPDAPCAEPLTQRIAAARRRLEIERRNQEDRTATVGRPDLTGRPFFRHWLNTGFYHAQDRGSGRALLDYLNEELPYLPEWSQEFLAYTEEGGIHPVSAICALGKDMVEVRFHLRYMAFFLNGQPVHRPRLPWERVAALEDVNSFFFLLPLAVATYPQYEAVKAEILRRLRDTAAPESGRTFIAGCLADQVCVLPPPEAVGLGLVPAEEQKDRVPLPPESILPFEVFAENAELLYVCVWFQRERILALYQQTSCGKQAVKGAQYRDVPDAETALSLARQLLEEQLFPRDLPFETLNVLPDAVYVQWDYSVVCHDEDPRPLWNIPKEILGEAVTQEKLANLLTWFIEGRAKRLEWSWRCDAPAGEALSGEPWRSLVFLRDKGQYACLYFDDFRAESYALLERPEVYGRGTQPLRLVPFLRSRLFSQVLHHHFSTIRRHLGSIFSQVSGPNRMKFMAGGIWSCAVNVNHGRVKYNLDKQLLAGFPMERACNRLDAPYYFPLSPNTAVLTRKEGGAETLEVTEGNRLCLQEMLAQFIQGGGSKLRLTWGRETGRRRHIVLLQENGRFLMAWILEEEQTVEFHVADCWTYLNVEGKTYPKDTFQGRVTPAYLIHSQALLRNALDLLLANMEMPDIVTKSMGEYAGEKPVNPQPYEVLWAELAGDTQPECSETAQ